VFQQLCSGVRYLDLRIGSEGKIDNQSEIDVETIRKMDLPNIRNYAKKINLPLIMVSDVTNVDSYREAIIK
jgi:hypothetical protein